MNNGVWKFIATGLITLLLGAASAVYTIGTDRPTRAEVKELIQAQTPSPAEWQMLKDQVIAVRIEQARTSERLDLLLKRAGGK